VVHLAHRRISRIGREYAGILSLLAAGIECLGLVVTRHTLGWTSPPTDDLSADVVGMSLTQAFDCGRCGPPSSHPSRPCQPPGTCGVGGGVSDREAPEDGCGQVA
jgi:hypothetical protein